MRSAQRVWSCTTLSITPFFSLFFFHTFDFHAKSSDSIYFHRKIYCFHRGKIDLKTRYSPVVAHSQDADTQEGTENVIGSKFSDLASIIAQVEDKKRVGVCLDTCKPAIYFIVSYFDEMD